MPKKKLLLHSCCAPCTTVAVERLFDDFELFLYFYNPCIGPSAEYQKRLESLQKLSQQLGLPLLEADYCPAEFKGIVGSDSKKKEGGSRCQRCILQRLSQTAEKCRQQKIEYFTTTLTTGPTKAAAKIFPQGRRLASDYRLNFIELDFKKENGFQRSVELSKKYQLYRQNYCGCIY